MSGNSNSIRDVAPIEYHHAPCLTPGGRGGSRSPRPPGRSERIIVISEGTATRNGEPVPVRWEAEIEGEEAWLTATIKLGGGHEAPPEGDARGDELGQTRRTPRPPAPNPTRTRRKPCTCGDGKCPRCREAGTIPCDPAVHTGVKCQYCAGTGRVRCPGCGGSGRHPRCGGKGWIVIQ